MSLGDSLSSGEGVMEAGGWRHAPCHRSSLAGPARAARDLEDADPHSSVSFVHLACSGASVDKGLLNMYRGVTGTGEEPPQLERAKLIAGKRTIDTMVLSIGINDIGFGKIAEVCLPKRGCQNLHVTEDDGTRILMPQFLTNRAAAMPAKYARLAAKLSELGIPAAKVHLIEYPDELHGASGQASSYRGPLPCGVPFGGGVIPVQLLPDETSYLYDHFELVLRNAVSTAASAHGFKMITGMFSSFRLHGLDDQTQDRWFLTARESCARQGDKEGSLHPNNKGHLKFGTTVLTDLKHTLDVK
jgi:hypothetical protein